MANPPITIALPAAALKAATEPRTEKCLTLDPAPPNARSRAALKRCCAAWQRAYKAYFEREGCDPARGSIFADRDAAEAYCRAMPMLDGYEGVRNFIACAAHGILIGAIPSERSGQLIYAAQIALSFLKQEADATRSNSSQPRSTHSSFRSITVMHPTPSPQVLQSDPQVCLVESVD